MIYFVLGVFVGVTIGFIIAIALMYYILRENNMRLEIVHEPYEKTS